MSQGSLHRDNARGNLDADYLLAHVHKNLNTNKENNDYPAIVNKSLLTM
jgi:hypothetical protein